jgi:hypothetical protein
VKRDGSSANKAALTDFARKAINRGAREFVFNLCISRNGFDVYEGRWNLVVAGRAFPSQY